MLLAMLKRLLLAMLKTMPAISSNSLLSPTETFSVIEKNPILPMVWAIGGYKNKKNKACNESTMERQGTWQCHQHAIWWELERESLEARRKRRSLVIFYQLVKQLLRDTGDVPSEEEVTRPNPRGKFQTVQPNASWGPCLLELLHPKDHSFIMGMEHFNSLAETVIVAPSAEVFQQRSGD